MPAIGETTRQTAPGPLVRPRAGESSGHFPQTRGQQGVSGSDCSVFPCQPVTSGAISAPTGRKGSQSVTKQARSRRKAEQGDETPSRPENHSVRTKGGREGEEGEVPRGELGLIQGAGVLWSPERRGLLLGGHRHPGSRLSPDKNQPENLIISATAPCVKLRRGRDQPETSLECQACALSESGPSLRGPDPGPAVHTQLLPAERGSHGPKGALPQAEARREAGLASL